MAEIDTERLMPLVKKVADSISSTYPSYVQTEDIESTIYIWCWENKNMVTDIMRDSERWEQRLYNMIAKIGHKAAFSEDGAVNGYSQDDMFEYSTDLIKELLTHVFDYEDWQKFGLFGEAGMPRLKTDPSKSGNQLAMFSDIKRALEALPEDQYNAILWVYKYNYTQVQLGEELGITQGGANAKLRRAVAALQRELGKRDFRDLRGDQEAVQRRYGNAEANAVTDRQYEG